MVSISSVQVHIDEGFLNLYLMMMMIRCVYMCQSVMLRGQMQVISLGGKIKVPLWTEPSYQFSSYFSYANVNLRENNILGALAKYLGGFPLVYFLILEAQDSGIVRFIFENILCTYSVIENDLELPILLPVNSQGLELQFITTVSLNAYLKV